MATRKNRRGQYKKATRRTRRKPATSLSKLAVSGLVANSITQGMFNTNLVEFVTGNTGTAKFGSDGSYTMSLPELLGVGSVKFGGNYGAGINFQSALMRNIKDNWAQIAMGVIFIPVAANVLTKVIRKPIILPANRMLKSFGIKEVKV